jgi:hypothetical protein
MLHLQRMPRIKVENVSMTLGYVQIFTVFYYMSLIQQKKFICSWKNLNELKLGLQILNNFWRASNNFILCPVLHVLTLNNQRSMSARIYDMICKRSSLTILT